MRFQRAVAAMIFGCGVFSCDGAPKTDEDPQLSADSADSQRAVMPGMTDGNDLSVDMKQQISMMQGVGPDSMKALLPSHRQVAANMLAQMNQQMTRMNMPVDAEWTALTDSIRVDLNRVLSLEGQQLHGAIAAHHQRLTRLMTMHDSMMKNMRM